MNRLSKSDTASGADQGAEELRGLRERVAALEEENRRLREQEKLWVPAGHYYSPLVDPRDEHARRATEEEAHPTVPLEALGINEQEIIEWFGRVAQRYGEHPFPDRAGARGRYYYENPQFPLMDALALAAVLAEKQPRRMIEIGAGFSSCAAIDASERYCGGRVQMRFIEPYPETLLGLLEEGAPERECILRAKAQDVPTAVFQELGAGDVLFIDSSHVGKTGSDVLDYLFRIFPALAPGVVVHVHDIFYPFEYPAGWIVEQNRSWNEAYLLRAYLTGNAGWRVLFFSDWIYKCRRELMAREMPLCVQHRGGSLWMEKAKA